jgi:hypothetical protein
MHTALKKYLYKRAQEGWTPPPPLVPGAPTNNNMFSSPGTSNSGFSNSNFNSPSNYSAPHYAPPPPLVTGASSHYNNSTPGNSTQPYRAQNNPTPNVTSRQSINTPPVNAARLRAANAGASGVGVLSSALNVYGNLTHRAETDQGTVYNDPQYFQAGLNTLAGVAEANNLRNALRPAASAIGAAGKAVAPTAGKFALRNIPMTAPAMGMIGAGARYLDKDYLGAGIDAVSAAAPVIGTLIAPGVGTAIGTGVSWLGQGINAYRDIRKNRQDTKLPAPITPSTPRTNYLQANTPDLQKKGTFSMYTSNNDLKIKKAFASGFVKAAIDKEVSIRDFSFLTKKALSSGNRLTYDDVAAIKAQLASEGITDDIYDDPSGKAMRNYKAKLLASRDAASTQIPAVSASLVGLREGGLGALAGAGIGGTLGLLAKHTPILNVPFKYRRNLPTLGSLGGSALGGIVTALPAAKKRYESLKALQKLNDPANLQALQQVAQDDNLVLNS